MNYDGTEPTPHRPARPTQTRQGGLNQRRGNHQQRRRHSEPLSLLKRMKTFHKRRQSSCDKLGTGSSIRLIHGTASESRRKRRIVRRLSLDLFRRKRCTSEPMIYPGTQPRSREEVVNDIYQLFYGHATRYLPLAMLSGADPRFSTFYNQNYGTSKTAKKKFGFKYGLGGSLSNLGSFKKSHC